MFVQDLQLLRFADRAASFEQFACSCLVVEGPDARLGEAPLDLCSADRLVCLHHAMRRDVSPLCQLHWHTVGGCSSINARTVNRSFCPLSFALVSCLSVALSLVSVSLSSPVTLLGLSLCLFALRSTCYIFSLASASRKYRLKSFEVEGATRL